MKKLFLPFILVLSIKGYGQTYTMELLFRKPQITCNEVFWTLSDYTLEDYITIGTKTYTDIPNYETFKLSSFFFCPVTTPTPECERVSVYNDEKSAIQLIKGSTLNIIGCYANIRTTSFKPNVTIKNLAPNGSTTVCSGEQLQLAGFPAGFPNEAYHWQYSLDNQQTWIDVPTNFNNNPTTNFSIQDVLGDSHLNYFDKQLYFRLGYQNRPFAEPLAITYSPCAPVVKDVVFGVPDCAGGDIKSIDIIFDRKLESNEYLTPIYIQEFGTPNGGSIDVLTGPQLYPYTEKVTSLTNVPNTTLYKYSVLIPKKADGANEYNLGANKKYKAVYQAYLMASPFDLPKGTIYSEAILYKEPEPLRFSIDVPAAILCNGGITDLGITVTGGNGDYRFYKDGVEVTPEFLASSGKYYLKGLIAKPEGYKIKVTDNNYCIEK
jgi:hypothetical protein